MEVRVPFLVGLNPDFKKGAVSNALQLWCYSKWKPIDACRRIDVEYVIAEIFAHLYKSLGSYLILVILQPGVM